MGQLADKIPPTNKNAKLGKVSKKNTNLGFWLNLRWVGVRRECRYPTPNNLPMFPRGTYSSIIFTRGGGTFGHFTLLDKKMGEILNLRIDYSLKMQ